MKRFRLLLIIAAALVLLLVIAVGVAFNSSFQTWAVGRALAAQPGMKVTVAQVSAGLKRVELRNVRFEREGVVLVAPLVEAELPLLSAALARKIYVSRVTAKGWLVDLSRVGPPAASGASRNPLPTETPGKTLTGGAVVPAAATRVFAGIFPQLQLPADVSISGVDLAGEVILPESRGRMTIVVKGGGMAAGQEGRFELSADAALTDPKVSAVALRGELMAVMDSPRTFTGLAAKLNASASGTQFPQGVKVVSEISATRSANGEAYSVGVVNEGQEILVVKADFPKNARSLEGTWKMDVRDADIAPFAFGKPLPAFTAVGEGKFDTDASFSGLRVTGRLNATADRLDVLLPQVGAVGELKIVSAFDLAESGGTFVVRKIEAAVTAAEPVASVRTLQEFEFNPKTGDLRAADATRELLGVVLHGLPIAWAKPFLTGLDLSGGFLRGELVATPRGGGMAVRSTKQLTIDGITLAHDGKRLVERVDISLNSAADYTPQGWQAELSGMTARTGDVTLLTLNARLGQLAGAAQPLKATGVAVVNLPGLLAQPLAENTVALSKGEATIDFAASLAAKNELQAKLTLRNLAPKAEAKPVALPNLSAEVRADIGVDGKIAFHVPLMIERNDRKSDLTIAGSVGPERDKARAIDANLTSGQLFIDDAQILSVLLPEKPEKKPDGRPALPPWAGVHGAVALQLKRVVYGDSFEVTNLTGRLKIDAGMLKLEGLQAGLGEAGHANLSGAVTFNSTVPQPYGLSADVAVKQFDPVPLLRAVNPDQAPTLEGRFDVASKLSGRAVNLSDLASGAGGEFQLTSKGGTFRGLPVNVGQLVEKSSRLAEIIASAGSVLSGLTGKKDATEFANKAQAVVEFAKGINPIPYDQLSVVLTRDAALNTTLRNFTLISPEVRLTGSGTALHREGGRMLEDSLAMEFKLRARGRQGELLKYLGLLEPQPDDFGYAACTLPLKVGGTIGKPDSTELNSKLAALALEKSGMTEKASELFNKVFGGGK